MALVVALVPAMVAWSHSDVESGSTEDADFWWLLPSVVFQLLALATIAAPMLVVKSARTPGRRLLWTYVCAGAAVTVSAIPLHLWATVQYSSTAMFLSNVVVALLQVQLCLTTFALGLKGKTE